MKFIYPFLFFCLLLSCSQSSQKTDAVIPATPVINEQSTDTIFIPSKNDIAASPFLINYIETVLVDSETVYQEKKISIKHTPITTGYLLPKKYILDKYTKHKKPFIYYTQTVINIGQNQFLINKEQINAHLDSTDNQLKKYGILLLNKTDINLVEEDVKLSYIYSIPYTDERALVDVLINTTTGEKIIRVE